MSKTTKDFIQRVTRIHRDRYDYSEVKYINNKTKVKIICAQHGGFRQTPQHHLRGNGCLKCAVENNAKIQAFSTEEFIEKAKEMHGDMYSYSEVKYVNNHTKVKIICPEHGIFCQEPRAHLNEQGCPKCGLEKLSEILRSSTEEFIEKAKKLHGNIYDYSQVVYINYYTKIKIICPEHGLFHQLPGVHLDKRYTEQGCPKCGMKSRIKALVSSKGEFIEKAKEIHGDMYSYANVDYKTARIKIEITCPKHGLFYQTPDCHLRGQGCPGCSLSHGESKIIGVLDTLQVIYKRQYRFPDCRNQRPLSFDFYLPRFNLCIEYDGAQHFELVVFSGMTETQAKVAFQKAKKHDKIKDEYCKKNNIELLRIPYTQYDKIKSILIMAYNILNLKGILGVPCDYFHVSRLLAKQKGEG